RFIHTIPYPEWIKIIILVIGFTVISHTLYLHVVTYFSVTRISLLTGLEPVLSIVFSWLLFSEVPNLYIYLGGIPILAVVWYESFRLK
ncbi:DMT family transporter, partial [bacterium]|nr:DMT family transporter [bacterium]